MITNEHVVAMMKAAINETEAVPPFVSLLSKKNTHCDHMRPDPAAHICFFFSAGAQNDSIEAEGGGGERRGESSYSSQSPAVPTHTHTYTHMPSDLSVSC